ncbi:MAG: 3-oxoacyl-(acyl-carrier-protein) synthase 3 [Firmicutes bacterium ADurb.Bin248]|nr:MAG: 3-oxoacyl-(acyl-carrier-protein) synthase 3 [Firmicutes bacterium ADurb.Bin248]HOG01923.1 beta-ketoacyl-ACP synthase III [Clostridia bacterium]HPK16051.1 beta-ketoacyl-ACP synthase III [Clostridia bacterium]
MSFSLIGTGSAYPARRVTNDELARLVDTSDEWIRARTGVYERRVLTDESLEDIACAAALRALEDAGVAPRELDLIVCATIRNDYITPSLACLLQKRLGAGCMSMDINAACSGFLYALDVADGYFARGRIKKALVVAAEAMSKMVDWTDRATCVLFGDGAGAAVLSEGNDLLSLRVTASGNAEHLGIPNIEGECPFSLRAGKPQHVYMNGQEVYKFAVNALCRELEAIIDAAGVRQEDIAFVLPHQANTRIIDAAAGKLRIGAEKYLSNIERFGNTSAASIPILMDECRRKNMFHPGDLLALSAFGGGFTTGACVLRWCKQS